MNLKWWRRTDWRKDNGGPVVLITGASSGIGRALALAWAARGATLVLMARRDEELRGVANEVRDHAAKSPGGAEHRRVFYCVGDVTNAADRQRFIDLALAETHRIDVLVNNAGRGYYAATSDVDIEEFENILHLNVVAPLALTQLATDALARSGGAIVMVSSVTGVVATPKMGAYAASKSALEALSISMRAELAPRGIHVLVARPGPVETDFRTNALRRFAALPKGDTRQPASEVANQIIRATEARLPIVETTSFVRFASFAARVFPSALRSYNGLKARHSP
jgi:short-subunit dehydrogenase